MANKYTTVNDKDITVSTKQKPLQKNRYYINLIVKITTYQMIYKVISIKEQR